MKLRFKILTCAVTLIVLLTATILASHATVPTGVSGVNFAQVYTTELQHETLAHIITGDEDWWPYINTVPYNQSNGGFTINCGYDNASLAPILQPGEQWSVQFKLSPGYEGGLAYENPLFEYITNATYYFASAKGTAWNGNNSWNLQLVRIHFYTATRDNVLTEVYSADGTHAFLLNTALPNNTIEYVEFVFVNQHNEPINFNQFTVWEFTIMQENPIWGHASSTDPNAHRQTTNYVPFNEQWLIAGNNTNEEAAYNRGYQDGFATGKKDIDNTMYENGYFDGTTEANGSPIQRWGAFLLTATNSVMQFEIFPNFPLWGLLAVVISVPLLLLILKMFMGG